MDHRLRMRERQRRRGTIALSVVDGDAEVAGPESRYAWQRSLRSAIAISYHHGRQLSVAGVEPQHNVEGVSRVDDTILPVILSLALMPSRPERGSGHCPVPMPGGRLEAGRRNRDDQVASLSSYRVVPHVSSPAWNRYRTPHWVLQPDRGRRQTIASSRTETVSNLGLTGYIRFHSHIGSGICVQAIDTSKGSPSAMHQTIFELVLRGCGIRRTTTARWRTHADIGSRDKGDQRRAAARLPAHAA